MTRLSVRAAAAERPDSPALITPRVTLTWSALAARVESEAARLAVPSDPPPLVSLTAHPTVEAIVRLLALVERGLPALLLHPRLPDAARAEQAAAAGATVDGDAWPAGPSRPLGPPLPDDDRPLAVLSTSGSTGSPRGVVLTRGAFVASSEAAAARTRARHDDRWLLALPFAHVGGLSILTRMLACRGAVVLATSPGPFDPHALVAALDENACTLASLVPTQLARIVAEGLRAPASLRALLVGGAAAPPDVVARARRLGWPALITYGLTEACSQVATQGPDALADPEARLDDCGAPLPGVDLRILDGEIQLRGPTLLARTHPPAAPPARRTDDGWLRTGDAGSLDPRGRLRVHGRLDALIITGGENVHPEEVEAALLATPGIAAAHVFGVPDPLWGQRIACALVAAPEGPPIDGAVSAAIAARLAPHQRPRLVAWLDAIPLLTSGKPDRAATRAAATPRLEPLAQP